jgi:hypothetical protein
MKRILFRVNSIVSILSAVKLSLIVGVVFIIGCSKQLSFNELNDDEFTEIEVDIYESLQMQYSISILEELKMLESDYFKTESNELFIDTSSNFNNGMSVLSIRKYESILISLEKEWESLKSDRLFFENFKVISEEKINFIGKQVIYEHTKFTLEGIEREGISFLFKEKGNKYYNIYIQVNKDEYYPNNLKELLFCVRSMRTW